MGSFSFGEILTILLVVLIVFGPQRLPEMARRIGQLMGRARAAVQDFTANVQREYGEEASAITGVVEEFDGMRRDIGSAVEAVSGPSKPLQSPNGDGDDLGDRDPSDEQRITDVTAFPDDEWPTRRIDEGAGE